MFHLEELETRTLWSAVPTVNLSVEQAAADEATMTGATVRVSLDRAFGVQTTVKLSLSGTARLGREYAVSPIPLVFGPDDLSATVTISPLDDGAARGDRTVVVKVGKAKAGVYAIGEQSKAVVTVIDKEPQISMVTADAVAAETLSGEPADCGVYRIVQSGDQPLDIRFSLSGSAKAGIDYLLVVDGQPVLGQTLTVPPGPDGVSVTLAPIDDALFRTDALSAVLKLVAGQCYSVTSDPDGRSGKVLIDENDVSLDFALSSSGFRDGDKLSSGKYLTSSPTFSWINVPAGTQSFAFIVDTPCPVYRPFVQWVVYNLPAATTSISSDHLPSGAKQGPNSTGIARWLGPVAPPGTKHFYNFRLYALDADLKLPSGLTRAQVLDAISGHVLDTAALHATCGEGIPVYNDISSVFDDFF